MSIFERKSKAPAKSAAPKGNAKTAKSADASREAEKKPKAIKSVPVDKAMRMISRLASSTILAPAVSEKTARLASDNVVAFFVPLTANRVAIRQAVHELYGVRPVRVNVITVHSETTRFGRAQGRSSAKKKAFVTLPPGARIDLFESV